MSMEMKLISDGKDNVKARRVDLEGQNATQVLVCVVASWWF